LFGLRAHRERAALDYFFGVWLATPFMSLIQFTSKTSPLQSVAGAVLGELVNWYRPNWLVTVVAMTWPLSYSVSVPSQGEMASERRMNDE
jgi:hypothetical protein